MRPFLFVGLGGAIGSMLRYLVQVSTGRHFIINFPVGTLLVNISGCLLIGVLYGLSSKNPALNLEWKLFLMTGICGGYTTFSSFSLESVTLFKSGHYAYFILYTSLSFILGLLATVGGIAFAK